MRAAAAQAAGLVQGGGAGAVALGGTAASVIGVFGWLLLLISLVAQECGCGCGGGEPEADTSLEMAPAEVSNPVADWAKKA